MMPIASPWRFSKRSLIPNVLVLILSVVFCSPLLAEPSGSIQSGGFAASFTEASGLTLSYRGVPISRHNTLVVVNPGWSQVYFDQVHTTSSVTTSDTATGAQMEIMLQNDAFRAGYEVTLTAAGSCSVALTGTLLKPIQDARMEYAAAYFAADPVAGTSFAAATDSGPASGTVPFSAASADEYQSRLTAPFNSLTFESRIGSLRLDVSGDRGPYVIFDARKNPQDWAKPAPIFWIGLLASNPLPTDRSFTTTLTYTISSPPPSVAAPAATAAPQTVVRPIARAIEPYTPPPVLIPKPRFSRIDAGRFRLDPSVRIITGPGEGDRRAASSLQGDLERRFKERLPIVQAAGMMDTYRAIVIGTVGTPWGQVVAAAGAVDPPPHPEAYAIRMDPDQIWLCGRDPAGTYYSAQTLEELAGVDLKGVYFQRALVADYPLQSFRGAHLFPSHDGLAFEQRLIQNVLAHFKLNRLVLESEYTRWDSHPELAMPWSPSKADVA
ncbi:MAG TPA: glycoside hydrolase family 20 zincin-like fold domain-containing protein, partial [Armatimonadota bacterium]|nr:glycoside hydrolase family 20 zincin-like fold domain-containing protein [Armatimonadota bacterium]